MLEKEALKMSVEFEKTVLEKFDKIDQRFASMDAEIKDFREEMQQEFWAVRTEIQTSSDVTNQKIDALSDRVGNVESIVKERWDVPDLKIRLETLDEVVGEHSQQFAKLFSAD